MARTGRTIDIELWKCWREKKDKRAEEELVKAYIPLVNYVVSRLSTGLPSTVDRDDLTSFGHMGLLDAMKKFDYDRGLQFETYAMWRIRGAIMDGLRSNDLIPRSARDRAKKIEEAYQVLEQKYMRSATDQEVCAYLGISEQELSHSFSDTSFANNMSLNEPIHDDENEKNYRQSFIIDEKAKDPQKALDESAQKQQLADVIDRLSEKERLVITLYYYEELNLTEIAEVMNLSPSRISQLHSKALSRIKTVLTKS